jgi:putative transposase
MQFSQRGIPFKPDVETASDEEWDLACRRAAAMQALLASGAGRPNVIAAAEELGISTAMMYRLLARFRKDPSPNALLPGPGGRRTGTRLLHPETECIIQRLVKTYYLKREQPRIMDLYRQVAAECRRNGLPRASYKAIWLRVSQLDPVSVVRGREGERAAREKFAPVSTGLRPKAPLELFQIDHTLTDVIVVDELDRKTVGRPWLTLVIDVATRMVAGFYISLDAPSSVSVALAISNAVMSKATCLKSLDVEAAWPIEGLPSTIHLDNGMEFHAQALERGCKEHNIALRYRPKRTPHFGGHIERLIGTLMGDLHLLPGTTFSSVEARGRYASEGKAALTLRELERWLTIQIVQIYHNRPHRGIGTSPLSAWTAGVSQPGFELKKPSDPGKFYVDFLPGEFRQIRRDGIQMFGIHYWHNVLSPIAARGKQKYLIRYDPRDLSHVYVKDPYGRNYIKVPYRNLANPTISLLEHRSVLKRLKRLKASVDEKTMFAAVLQQRDLLEKACKDTASARREREKARTRTKSPAPPTASVPMPQGPEPREGKVEPYKVEVWD